MSTMSTWTSRRAAAPSAWTPPRPTAATSAPRRPRLGEGHIAGTLTDYRPFESVAVERKGWIAGIGPTT